MDTKLLRINLDLENNYNKQIDLFMCYCYSDSLEPSESESVQYKNNLKILESKTAQRLLKFISFFSANFKI